MIPLGLVCPIVLGLVLGLGGLRYDLPPAPHDRDAARVPSSELRTVPPPERTPGPAKARSGIASTYGPGFAGYLALPEGRGIRVRICGPAACVVRRSNDAGPNRAMQRKGRIVDLDVATFERVCGCSWRKGLVRVTVEYLR